MNHSKKIILPMFANGPVRKGIVVSIILHLAIFMTFFMTPMVKNIPKPQIIYVALQDENEVVGTRSAIAPLSSFHVPKRQMRQLHSVENRHAESVVPDSAQVQDEKRKDIVQDEVIAEDQPSGNVRATATTVAVVGVAANGISETSPLENNAAHDRSGKSAGADIADARFGEHGAPTFVYREMPVYPALARRLGKEGRVVLQLMIDADGKLLNVEVVEAAGYGFTEASVAAARKSVYAPGYRDGIKVATRALLPVTFRLQ